jgi:heme/copper-type cytochrome/quinol oxidase subunit 2
MRIRWIIAGILIVVGAVWIGQGMGLFNGSGFMDNNRIWAVIGAVLIVAGVVVGWTAVRARRQV